MERYTICLILGMQIWEKRNSVGCICLLYEADKADTIKQNVSKGLDNINLILQKNTLKSENITYSLILINLEFMSTGYVCLAVI